MTLRHATKSFCKPLQMKPYLAPDDLLKCLFDGEQHSHITACPARPCPCRLCPLLLPSPCPSDPCPCSCSCSCPAPCFFPRHPCDHYPHPCPCPNALAPRSPCPCPRPCLPCLRLLCSYRCPICRHAVVATLADQRAPPCGHHPGWQSSAGNKHVYGTNTQHVACCGSCKVHNTALFALLSYSTTQGSCASCDTHLRGGGRGGPKAGAAPPAVAMARCPLRPGLYRSRSLLQLEEGERDLDLERLRLS